MFWWRTHNGKDSMHCLVSLLILALTLLECPSLFKARNTEPCHAHRKVRVSMVVSSPNNLTLDQVSVNCSKRNTVVEARFVKGDLCICQRIRDTHVTRPWSCKNKLKGTSVNLTASFNTASSKKESCVFTLHYTGPSSMNVPFTLDFPSPSRVSSVLPTSATSISSSIITSNVVSSAVVSSPVVSSTLKQTVVIGDVSMVDTSPSGSSTMVHSSIISPVRNSPARGTTPIVRPSTLTPTIVIGDVSLVDTPSLASSTIASSHGSISTEATSTINPSSLASTIVIGDVSLVDTPSLASSTIASSHGSISTEATSTINPSSLASTIVIGDVSLVDIPSLASSTIASSHGAISTEATSTINPSSPAPTVVIGVVSTIGYSPLPPTGQPFSRDLTSSSSPISSPVSTEALSTRPSLITSSLVESTMGDTTSVILTSSTTTSTSSSRVLSSEVQEEKQYNEDVEFINKLNISSVNISDEKTIERVLDAATNVINSNRTGGDGQEDQGIIAVKKLQDLGMAITGQLDLGNESSVIFQKSTKDVVFGAAVINTTSTSGFSFPSAEKNNDVGDEKIDIPSSVFESSSGKASFVGLIFTVGESGEMRKKTGDFAMGSKVINVEISPPPAANLTDPVEMTFEKTLIGSSFQEDCSFWIENSSSTAEHGRWSTRGCMGSFQNATHIKCKCFHLTNFAVLFKITDDQDLSEEDSFRLVIITYIGLGLSILGCFLTFVIYVTLKNIKSDRAAIHTNLVFALGIADIIFLLAVAVKPDGDVCLAIAMLTFYFYLAVFFWMLVEGIYIYLMVIKVFRGHARRRRRLAYLVGWGCPVLIALVTWAILQDDVVSKYHCWLSVDSGAIWAFVGPGLFIILVNMIILMTVMRTTWATFVDEKEYGGLKSATKTFGAVIPILGITWVFGVMTFNETSVVFQYIFAITNSIQGILIFILYCLINNEVRHEIRRRIIVWQTRRDITSSTAARRPTYGISSEKNTTFNRSAQSGPWVPDPSRYPLNEIKESPAQVENYSFQKTDLQVNEPDKEDFALTADGEKQTKEVMQADQDDETKGRDRDSIQDSPAVDEHRVNDEHRENGGYANKNSIGLV